MQSRASSSGLRKKWAIGSDVHETIAQFREETLLEVRETRLGLLSTSSKFPDELLVARVEFRRRENLYPDFQIAPTRTAKPRDSAVFDREYLGALTACTHFDINVSVERVNRCRRTEDGVGHVEFQGAKKVVAVATEHLMGAHLYLEIQVTIGPAGGPDFAAAWHLEPQSGLHSGRNIDRHGPARPNPSLPLAGGARRNDHGAETTAGAAGAGGHDITEQRSDSALDLPRAVTDVASDGSRTRLATSTVTGFAKNRRVDFEISVRAEDHFVEGHLDSKESVLATLTPRLRTANTTSTTSAEERLENIAEAAEARSPKTGLRPEVILLSLFRIAQHVIRVRHKLEAFGCLS